MGELAAGRQAKEFEPLGRGDVFARSDRGEATQPGDMVEREMPRPVSKRLDVVEPDSREVETDLFPRDTLRGVLRVFRVPQEIVR